MRFGNFSASQKNYSGVAQGQFPDFIWPAEWPQDESDRLQCVVEFKVKAGDEALSQAYQNWFRSRDFFVCDLDTQTTQRYTLNRISVMRPILVCNNLDI